MPTFRELSDLFGGVQLSPDHIIVVHPDDFRDLRLFLDLESEYPHFPRLEQPSVFGARVVSHQHQARGCVSILTRPELPRFSSVLGLPAFTDALPPEPTPAPEAAKSLWELLEDE